MTTLRLGWDSHDARVVAVEAHLLQLQENLREQGHEAKLFLWSGEADRLAAAFYLMVDDNAAVQVVISTTNGFSEVLIELHGRSVEATSYHALPAGATSVEYLVPIDQMLKKCLALS